MTLVSSVEGALRRLHHVDEIESLPSLVCFAPEPSLEGDTIRRTVDLYTAAGYAHLVHQQAAQVEADYARLRELQSTMFEVV